MDTLAITLKSLMATLHLYNIGGACTNNIDQVLSSARKASKTNVVLGIGNGGSFQHVRVVELSWQVGYQVHGTLLYQIPLWDN